MLMGALVSETFAQSNIRSTRRGGSGSTTRGGALGNQDDAVEADELPPLSEEAQAAMDQFESTRVNLVTNQRMIDQLYRTLPSGFIEKQRAHMQKIKAIEAQNVVLEQRVVQDAIELFRLAPTRNRHATELVLEQVREALDPKDPDSHYDPKLALEICSLLLDEENLPWEILIRAFRASYAIQDFERARMILNRLEQIGDLKPIYYELLERTSQKWQDELLVRRLEDQTGDLPIATFETTAGKFQVELFENQAPLTVNNFVALAEEGFYNGRVFYKVIPGAFALTGCPNDSGIGTIGYSVEGEATNEKARSHFAGTLTMVVDDQGNTDSKFMICHQPTAKFDGRHTAFGRIKTEQGLNVVYELNSYDATKFRTRRTEPSKILSVTISNKRSHKYVKTPVGSAITPVADDSPIGDAQYSPSSFDLLQQNN
jgi:peptidyl-prolyl cis-trans isomerase B (cyclophilin B)